MAFIIGFIIGGNIGVLAMSLFCAAKEGDK